ncbi:MAG: peptidoglycan-binding protein [Clostridia bacterium]|nr:peptidoglycan-binding protein [Clostridia bacterium]
MNKINEFTELLLSQVGKGIYVWGGDGENLSEMKDPIGWIRKHETSTRNADRAVALYKKRVAAGVSDIRAFDCSGFMFWALQKVGILKSDINSRGLYRVCTPIEKSSLKAGDLIFRWSDKDDDGFDVSEIYHVGAMIDGKTLIECQGRDVGVVNGTLSSRWNAFGRIAALQQSEADENFVFTRALKRGDKGEDVRQMQLLLLGLDYDLGSYGADGDFGSRTEKAVTAFQKAEVLQYGTANALTLQSMGGVFREE